MFWRSLKGPHIIFFFETDKKDKRIYFWTQQFFQKLFFECLEKNESENGKVNCAREHPSSLYTKFYKKLIFFTIWYGLGLVDYVFSIKACIHKITAHLSVLFHLSAFIYFYILVFPFQKSTSVFFPRFRSISNNNKRITTKVCIEFYKRISCTHTYHSFFIQKRTLILTGCFRNMKRKLFWGKKTGRG